MARPIEILIKARDEASTVIRNFQNTLSGLRDKITEAFSNRDLETGRFKKTLMSQLGDMLSSNPFGQMAMTAGGFALAQLGIQGMTAALETGKSAFIDYNASMEQAQISFETMLGSAEAAQTFINDMQKFAAQTPFEFPEVRDAAQKFLAFGWAARDVIPTLTAVGNAVSGLGKGKEGIESITRALGQIQAKGRVQGEELLQLAEAGIPAYEILAEKLKLTGVQVAKIGEQGISADRAIKALVEGMNERFPDMMKKQSQTFNGLMSTVKDNMGIIGGFLGRPMFDAAKSALEGVANAVGLISKHISEGNYTQLLNMFPPEWQARISRAYDLLKWMEPAFIAISEAVGTFLSVSMDLADFFGGIFADTVLNSIEMLAWFPIKAVEGWQQIGTLFGEMSVEIEAYLTELWDAFMKFVDDLPATFEQCWQNIKDGITAAWNGMFEGPLNSIKEFVNTALSYLEPLRRFFSLGEVAQIGPKLQAALAKDEYDTNILTNMVNGMDIGDALEFDMTEYDRRMNLIDRKFDERPLTALEQKVADAEEKKKANNAAGRAGVDGHKRKNGPSWGGTKGGGELEKLSNKIQSTFESLNEKIIDETGTTYEMGFAKVNDELAKMQRELIDRANAAGIDTTELESKMEEYRVVMTEPIKRAWRENWAEMKNQTNMVTAKMLGDKRAEAEAEFQITVTRLDKERREKFKSIAQDQNDAAARAAVDKWYNESKKTAEKKRDEDIQKGRLDDLNSQIEINNLGVELYNQSTDEIRRLNREAIDEKIAMLELELKKEGHTTSEILRLRRELKQAMDQKSDNPLTDSEAIGNGLKKQIKEWGDWKRNLEEIGKQAATSLQQAFSDFFFDAMTGQLKSFGDYVKSFLTSVARAISNAFANMFANKLIGSLFGGILGKAEGGPVYAGTPYIVGERGPELFVPSGNGSIAPRGSFAAAPAVPPTVVNVYNNTGTKAQVRQETNFDGKRIVANIWLEAFHDDIGGMRSLLTQGAR